jgi:imidazolonepropionase-like amidohydrolase
MRIRVFLAVISALAGLFGAAVPASAQQITIRAATVLDGKGGVLRNAVVAVEGSRIVKVGGGAAETVTYDFPRFTVLPGMIDAHVHIGNHFGKDGRAVTPGETPDEAALYGAANAYAMLMAGFTTVQSIGAPSDVPLRDAIARRAHSRPAAPDGRAAAHGHESDRRSGPRPCPQERG